MNDWIGPSVFEQRVSADRREGRRHQRQSAYHALTSLSDGGDTCANPHVKEYPAPRHFALFFFQVHLANNVSPTRDCSHVPVLPLTLFPAMKRGDGALKVSFSAALRLDLITQFVDEAAILGS